jgi:hypothetical protein
MKVIDSSIPASMYTIDEHNNTFRMFAFGLDTYDPEYDDIRLLRSVLLDFMSFRSGWTRTGTPTLSS